MKIIEKIRIQNFRSFLGTTKGDVAEVINVTDLNIFSGSNDSGKSNILRALNLFFNDDISRDEKFFYENDLNINKQKAGSRVVKIQVFFDISWDTERDRFLPLKFSISKFYDVNGFRNWLYEFKLQNIVTPIRIDSKSENNREVYKLFLPENFETLSGDEQQKQKDLAKKREWNYRVKFSGFLNKSIAFQYVPAIKDKSFFAYLYGKTISKLLTNEQQSIQSCEKEKSEILNWKEISKQSGVRKSRKDNLKDKNWREQRIDELNSKIESLGNIKKSIRSLEEMINGFSGNLFKSASFLDSEFKVGNNLREFFEGFDLGTGSDKNISLKLRGDGVQAKFIPEILNFLDSIQNDKKYFLWGFEEPENSSEYKNQQVLAKKLKNEFSVKKQIFITTHSEEFLSVYDGSEVKKENRKANLYHVKKASNRVYSDFSVIQLFDVERQSFELDSIESDIENDLGTSLIRAKYSKELKNKEEAFLKEKQELEEEIKNYTKPVLFVEGEFDQKIFKKIFGDKCAFDIRSCGCADEVANKLIGTSFSGGNYKIIGLFDKDEAGKKAVKKFSTNKRKSNNPCSSSLYLVPDTGLKSILKKQQFDFSIDDLMPDFVWRHLLDNGFLENCSKFRASIPTNKSIDDFLREKFPSDDLIIAKLSKKVKMEKKKDFQKYIFSLDDNNFQMIAKSLDPTIEKIKESFNLD